MENKTFAHTHTHVHTDTHSCCARLQRFLLSSGVKWVMVEDDKEEEGLGVSLSVRCLRLKLYNFWPGQTNHKYTHWFARTLKKKKNKKKKWKATKLGNSMEKRLSPLLGRWIRRSSCSRHLPRRRQRTWTPGPSPPSRYLLRMTSPLRCSAAFCARLSALTLAMALAVALLLLLLLLVLVLPSMVLFGIICMPQSLPSPSCDRARASLATAANPRAVFPVAAFLRGLVALPVWGGMSTLAIYR